MSDLVRGWCPGLFDPMETGDGWLVRLRPALSRIDTHQARLIADDAAMLGNGAIELTARASLQLRGFTPETARIFAGHAIAAGLAEADQAVERRRAIMVSPLAGLDPTCDARTLPVAALLAGALEAATGLEGISLKTGFVVDGGGILPLSHEQLDFVLRAGPDGWMLRVGGRVVRGTPEMLCTHILALARASIRLGSRAARCEGSALFDAAKLWDAGLYDVRDEAGTALVPVGPLCDGRALGIGLKFGVLDCALLRELAGLSQTLGDGFLRITPWRTIIIGGDAGGLAAGIARKNLDVVLDPSDPARRVVACPGAPACGRGTTPTRKDAASLVPFLPVRGLVHVSGCAKGCANPGDAAFTLVAGAGRYDLLRGDMSAGSVVATRQTIAEIGTLLQDMGSTHSLCSENKDTSA